MFQEKSGRIEKRNSNLWEKIKLNNLYEKNQLKKFIQEKIILHNLLEIFKGSNYTSLCDKVWAQTEICVPF